MGKTARSSLASLQNFRELLQVCFPGQNLNIVDPVGVVHPCDDPQDYLRKFFSERTKAAQMKFCGDLDGGLDFECRIGSPYFSIIKSTSPP